MKSTKIKNCRLCKSKKIRQLIDFGKIACSSTFPLKKIKYTQITPMVFCICEKCNLAQLLHNYSLNDLYNDNYGYRSGINQAMVKHLTDITNDIKKRTVLRNIFSALSQISKQISFFFFRVQACLGQAGLAASSFWGDPKTNLEVCCHEATFTKW